MFLRDEQNEITFSYLILPILIEIKSDHSTHFSADDIPEDFIPFPIDGLHGTVAAYDGQSFSILAEETSYDHVDTVRGLFEEEVSIVVDIVR